MDDMIWGVTPRSPHPYARIDSFDIRAALATPGVYAVLMPIRHEASCARWTPKPSHTQV